MTTRPFTHTVEGLKFEKLPFSNEIPSIHCDWFPFSLAEWHISSMANDFVEGVDTKIRAIIYLIIDCTGY